MADKKTIVATGYKQVGSRATPEAIGKNLRLLPPSAGPLDARKRALHDLSIALAYVSEKEKTAVVEICEKEDAAGRLLALLQDVWRSDAEENASIRLGRKTLAFGAMDAQLYVLSSFVNLAYFGGCGQLREKPQGLELSPMQLFVDTLLYPDNSDSVLFYAVSGLYNLSNDDSFAKLLSSEQKEKEVLAKLESLASSSSNPDTKNYASGTLDHWKTHYQGAWPPQ